MILLCLCQLFFSIVFSVDLVCKEELTSSQGAVGLSLRGTNFLFTSTLDLTYESNQ